MTKYTSSMSDNKDIFMVVLQTPDTVKHFTMEHHASIHFQGWFWENKYEDKLECMSYLVAQNITPLQSKKFKDLLKLQQAKDVCEKFIKELA